MRGQVPVQVLSPEATPEEAAAISTAFAVLLREREAAAQAAARTAESGDELHAWVRASRLTARRTGLMRGPWRLSGRIGRRARA
jgi:hypothetical protein